MPLCPNCGCQNLEEAEVCIGCGTVLRGKNCIACGEWIPLSAKVCPKCGKSQEAEIVKPWTCSICGTKNNPPLEICSCCGATKDAENYLSIDYLLKHSEKDDYLSIPSCILELANGQISSPLKVNVYSMNCSIKSNFDDRAMPVFTVKPFVFETFEAETIQPDTIGITMLRRGVIGVSKIGYVAS